jgi:precorrin-6B methylase 2
LPFDGLAFDGLPREARRYTQLRAPPILDALALAPADRLLDVGCGGGLLLRDNATTTPGPHRRTHDTIQSLEETLREHNAAVFAITSKNQAPALVSQAREH